MNLTVFGGPVELVARRVRGEKEIEVHLDAEHAEDLIEALQALIEEVCSVTGLDADAALGRLQQRMLD